MERLRTVLEMMGGMALLAAIPSAATPQEDFAKKFISSAPVAETSSPEAGAL